MLRYAQGEHAAFESLYNRHKGALYRYIVRQVSDRDLAHDLYQDCWSRIIKAAKTYAPEAKWTTWAYRIAHHLVIDHYRSFKPVLEEVELDSTQHAPERAYDQQALSNQLVHCLSGLPAVQREVFMLSQETDLTLSMIAEVVAASHEAVKTRLRYARDGLKACLKRFGHHPGSISQAAGSRS